VREAKALLLAAGKGTRMKSDLPKVALPVAGVPMVRRVVDSVKASGIDDIVVVVGHMAETVKECLAGYEVEFALQEPQLGTGHAVTCAREHFENFEGDVMVLAGDLPCLTAEALADFMGTHRAEPLPAATVASAVFPDPRGYGRIIRDGGYISGIVEDADASEEEKMIDEVNLSMYVFDNRQLFEVIDEISCDNEQNEFYLTDVIHELSSRGEKIRAFVFGDYRIAMGVNDSTQLRTAEDCISEREQVSNG
jgi:bifunctional UDP-N-acetylglucosamine pyrophosphorylase/glucosamine-1-phosphate N-acetyltransferase